MAAYTLIPGTGGYAWYRHMLEAELRGRGRDVVAVDLPAVDDSARLAEYAGAVVEAIGDRTDLIPVAHSIAASPFRIDPK